MTRDNDPVREFRVLDDAGLIQGATCAPESLPELARFLSRPERAGDHTYAITFAGCPWGWLAIRADGTWTLAGTDGYYESSQGAVAERPALIPQAGGPARDTHQGRRPARARS
jgi:hypothetical protein